MSHLQKRWPSEPDTFFFPLLIFFLPHLSNAINLSPSRLWQRASPVNLSLQMNSTGTIGIQPRKQKNKKKTTKSPKLCWFAPAPRNCAAEGKFSFANPSASVNY